MLYILTLILAVMFPGQFSTDQREGTWDATGYAYYLACEESQEACDAATTILFGEGK